MHNNYMTDMTYFYHLKWGFYLKNDTIRANNLVAAIAIYVVNTYVYYAPAECENNLVTPAIMLLYISV